MSIRKLDHVAMAVPSIAETIPLFCAALGGEFASGGDSDDTGIRVVHLRFPGFKLELMQPLRSDSHLQRHLDEHGPGFHHLTFSDGLGTTTLEFGATTEPPDQEQPGVTLDDVLDGQVVWRESLLCLRRTESPVHATNEIVHAVDTLLRSRRQGEILAVILTDPEAEFPLSGLARRLSIPYSSVHREIERAERYGIVTTRRFENLRLVRANVDSPYFASLAGLLRRA